MCMSYGARSVAGLFVRLRLLQMKAAATERPAKTDNDQVNSNDIVQHSRHHNTKSAAHLRSHCACLIGQVCRRRCAC
jgi:hypothetical protein